MPTRPSYERPTDDSGSPGDSDESLLPGLVHGSGEAGAEPEDEDAAERAAERAPDVSEAYDEALARGVEVEGEGAIDDREGRV